MKTHTYRLLSIVTLAAAGVFYCSLNDLAGGGSDVGNGMVVGKMVVSYGGPAKNTQVMLIPENYNPETDGPISDSLIDTTNSAGEYGFNVSKEGIYNILAVQLDSRQRLFIGSITVRRDATVNVPVDTLHLAGAIKVMLPDSVDAVNGYIYVPGTTTAKLLSGRSDFIVLDSVPAGIIPAVSYSTTTGTVSAAIRYAVRVSPGDTTVIFNPDWKYARQLVLNTSAAGAGVQGDVYVFPVLVRLTAGNFTFAQAKADGGDLRFTKADGSPLFYELARWDAANGFAEVWVKVDTVRGNNGAQYIIMFWGNPSAGSESSGAAVFDSSGGFEGVWHLNETSGTRARDASRNGFTGTYRGGLPKSEPGPTGICQNITRPDSDYVDMGNVLNPGMKNISVGVWVKPAAFGKQQALIAKTNGDGPSATYGYLLSIDLFNLPHFYLISGGATWGDDGTFDVSSNLAITDSAVWHYVFVVVDRSDNSRCKMYVDGIDRIGTVRGDVSRVADVANALSLRVGTENDNNYSLKGAIAEATIAFTARSADWVKLSYMNQKDALVTW